MYEAPPCEPSDAGEAAYWFALCQGTTLVADNCAAPTAFDTIVHVRRGSAIDGDDIDCAAGNCGSIGSDVTVPLPDGPELYWVLVDGMNQSCGVYGLDISF